MILVTDANLSNPRTISPTDFAAQGVWERKHIQEWVSRYPEVLGEPLLILSLEFDKFSRSDERIDALAADKAGNLVVIEFKRSPTAGAAELQALRYGALVASATLDEIAPYFAAHLSKSRGAPVTPAQAREEIVAFVEQDDLVELSDRPRIILCSQGFGAELTTTVMWLREFGIDISCVRLTPHELDGKLVIVPAKIIPLQETQEYVVRIRAKEEAVRKESEDKYTRSIPLLLSKGVIKKGDVLKLAGSLPRYVKNADPELLRQEEEVGTFSAIVTGSAVPQEALQWQFDNNTYAASKLAAIIFSKFHPAGIEPNNNGNAHWVNAEGVSLWDLAQPLRGDSFGAGGHQVDDAGATS